MEARKKYILIISLFILSCGIAYCLGDSVLYPKIFQYKTKVNLEECTNKFDLFFVDYGNKHEIRNEYVRKDKYTKGIDVINITSLCYNIDTIFSVDITCERKHSIFGEISSLFRHQAEKDFTIIQISFNYFPAFKDNKINYRELFNKFIINFEQFAKSKNLVLETIN